MRFDPETWDNVYDIPAELVPVIEELTNQNNSMKEDLRDLKAYRAELVKQGQADPYSKEYVKVVADQLGTLLRPLDD